MSSKLKSLERRNVVLGILILVLGAWLVLRPEPVTSARKEALSFVFPSLPREDVRRVELAVAAKGEEPAKRLVLEMGEGGKWHLESHFRYPLQTGADRLLDAIAAARQRAVVTERAETFDSYADAAGWTDVTVVDSRGRTMAAFGLGRYQYPDTFLKLGGASGARIVKATGIVPNMASTDPKSWVDTRVWPNLSSSKMSRIDVEQRRDDRTITIVRRGEAAADVEMEAPEKDPEGEKEYWMSAPVEGDAKKLAVEDLVREFTGMLIEDVVAGSLSPEEEKRYGFDDPELVATLFHKEGEETAQHRLTVGRKADDDETWYVRRSGAVWVFAVSSGTGVNRLRQAPEEFLEPPPAAESPPGDGDGAGIGVPDGDGAGDPDGEDGDAPADPPKDPPKDDAPKDPPKDDAPQDPPKDDG